MQPRTREYKNVLDSEDIGRLLVKLSGPVFMGMFVQTMYNVISTIFIGRYVGPLGIAGLSIAFPLQMFGYGVGSVVDDAIAEPSAPGRMNGRRRRSATVSPSPSS